MVIPAGPVVSILEGILRNYLYFPLFFLFFAGLQMQWIMRVSAKICETSYGVLGR